MELNKALQGLFGVQKNRSNIIEKNKEKVANDYLTQTLLEPICTKLPICVMLLQ